MTATSPEQRPAFGPGDTVILTDPAGTGSGGITHQATIRSLQHIPSKGWCYTLLYQGSPGREWWPEERLRLVKKV
jgi:hypothetical protein